MTPLELDILIHHYGRATDFRDGDFSAPAVRDAIDRFRDVDNLIETIPNEEKGLRGRACYRLTERGRIFVEHLQSIPLPEPTWTMPRYIGAHEPNRTQSPDSEVIRGNEG